MKYLLLILFSVVFNDCIGQKRDSLVFGNGVTTHTGKDSVTLTIRGGYAPGGGEPGTIIFHKQDTIRCLMLVCDTDSVACVGCASWATQKDGKWVFSDPPKSEPIPFVWWQYGYEVVGWRTGSSVVYVDKNGAIIFPDQIYLDQNKKPLPSSIVVWMTKEIK